MKFRGVISNVRLFQKIVHTVSTVHKCTLIHLSSSFVKFCVSPSSTDPLQMFLRVNVIELFEEYQIESMYKNEIYLKVNMDLLKVALTCTFENMVIKLSKVGAQPVINLTAKTSTSQVSQNVPIEVLAPSLAAVDLMEPKIPHPEVSLMMPDIKTVKSAIEKMAHISNNIQIQANMSGVLEFSVQSEFVDVTTTFDGLEPPMIQGQSVLCKNPNQKEKVVVPVKRILKVLGCSHLSPPDIVICVFPRKLVIHCILNSNDSDITYYIPGLIEEYEHEE